MQFLVNANPYPQLVERLSCPSVSSLVKNSAMLKVFGERKRFASAEEVAVAEYTFFTHETYLFEVVGLQLLGEMTSRLGCYDAIPALAEQSIDEARHVAAYSRVLDKLPRAIFDKQPGELHRAFVASGSVEQNAVTAFIVLESLAMGMFSARSAAFPGDPIAALDKQILFEESRHQDNGLEILSALIADGRISFRGVIEATRVAMTELSRLLSPAPLLAHFGIDAGETELAKFSRTGIVAKQKEITQHCVTAALRKLRRAQPVSIAA